MTMKGVVFLGNRKCALVDVPVPQPGYGEALVKIRASGICGSDLHVYRSDTVSDQIRGHEPCGEVVAIGPGVRRVKPGDRVVIYQHQGCGVCYECATGEMVACRNGKQVVGVHVSGGFAEFIVAPERYCIPLFLESSFLDGAFIACTASTAYGALRRLGVQPGGSLAVFGLGPVGLSAVIIAKAFGLHVIGIDILALRAELALTCGADSTTDAPPSEAIKEVRAFGATSGVGSDDGVDYAIEASGSVAGRRGVISVLRRGGKAALVGVGGDDRELKPQEVLNRALTVIGSIVFPVAWMWDLSLLCAKWRLSFEPAVTHCFRLENASDALTVADEGRGGKIVFTTEVTQ